MEDENLSREYQKYADDIKTIKDILIKTDESPIIETWAFYLSGAIVLLGTLFHYFAAVFWQIPDGKISMFMWLPLFLVLSFLEGFGVVRKLSSESLPLFSRTVINLYAGIIGTTISVIFIIYLLIKYAPVDVLPGSILAIAGIFYLQYAQVGYGFLFRYAYIGITAGIALYFTGLAVPAQFLITGLLIGISQVASGFESKKKERNING